MSWPLIVISVLGAILLPVLLAIALRRRFRVPWLLFCVGVLTFLAAQIVHLPLNALLERLGLLPELPAEGGRLVQAAAILGLTAGLTEELARAAGFWLLRRARTYAGGLMLGLGHGGIEAMVFGGVLLAAAASSLSPVQMGSPAAALPADQLAEAQAQVAALGSQPLLALAPLAERLLALSIQVGLSILVLQAYVRRNGAYVAAAVLYHALVNAVVVYAAGRSENVWGLLGMSALLAAPLLAWAWRAGRPARDEPNQAAAPVGRELRLLGRQLGKEMLFLWRSRRALIAGAVFVISGLMSPLLARFTPELLGAIEGAEQFAGLIPEPTIADAVSQYFKNVTQFGLIVVVLMGMGAVAGEKERGTAPLIMAKPLPRWAFVAGKYASQAWLYLIVLAAGAVAAYIYTLLLFEAPDGAAFLAANALLFLWLLVYLAVTLLASVLARSAGAAAGLAAAGVLALLLAGTLPRFGGLAPGALLGWAGQIALGLEVLPAGGAVALSLVLILLALVAAVAFFEEQEL